MPCRTSTRPSPPCSAADLIRDEPGQGARASRPGERRRHAARQQGHHCLEADGRSGRDNVLLHHNRGDAGQVQRRWRLRPRAERERWRQDERRVSVSMSSNPASRSSSRNARRSGQRRDETDPDGETSLRSQIGSRNYDGAAATIAVLKQSFDTAQAYWSGKSVADATAQVNAAVKAVNDLDAAAPAKNDQGLLSAQTAMNATMRLPPHGASRAAAGRALRGEVSRILHHTGHRGHKGSKQPEADDHCFINSSDSAEDVVQLAVLSWPSIFVMVVSIALKT